MVMERLDAAERLPSNRGKLQRFAIQQARRMLVEAGVKDPGPLVADASPATPNIPEGAVLLPDLTIGGGSKSDLRRALDQARYGGYSIRNIQVEYRAKGILRSPDFSTLPERKTLSLFEIAIKNMGLETEEPTLDQIYERATQLGWNLCPAEVAPRILLVGMNRSSRLRLIAMVPITGPGQLADSPSVLGLKGNSLDAIEVKPDTRFDSSDRFIFALRK